MKKSLPPPPPQTVWEVADLVVHFLGILLYIIPINSAFSCVPPIQPSKQWNWYSITHAPFRFPSCPVMFCVAKGPCLESTLHVVVLSPPLQYFLDFPDLDTFEDHRPVVWICFFMISIRLFICCWGGGRWVGGRRRERETTCTRTHIHRYSQVCWNSTRP